MSHEHGCCKHECLHYCDCCSKVYCCKCNQEWGGATYYQPYYYHRYDCPNWKNEVTCGSTTTYGYAYEDGNTTTACTHSHYD